MCKSWFILGTISALFLDLQKWKIDMKCVNKLEIGICKPNKFQF